MPRIKKKRLLGKKYKKHVLSSFQEMKMTQTSGSVCADRIEQVQHTKFELQLIEVGDCFLNGHGNYRTKILAFKIK